MSHSVCDGKGSRNLVFLSRRPCGIVDCIERNASVDRSTTLGLRVD
jgi:hypothetical protein